MKSESISLRRRRQEQEVVLDLTAMIDVTFLLLAFFVVITQNQSASINQAPANNGVDVPERNCVVLTVIPDAQNDSYRIYKGLVIEPSKQVQSTTEVEQEIEIGQYVQATLETNPALEAVLIKADKSTRNGMMQTVEQGVARSEFAKARPLFIGSQRRVSYENT